MNKITYSLEIILNQTGVGEEALLEWIEYDIISPYDQPNMLFDEEDLRRLRLIMQLIENCNSNVESLQVILHLVDQIHYLRKKIN